MFLPRSSRVCLLIPDLGIFLTKFTRKWRVFSKSLLEFPSDEIMTYLAIRWISWQKKKNTTGFLCQLKSGIFFSSSLIIQVTWTNEEIMIYLREDFNRNRLTLNLFLVVFCFLVACLALNREKQTSEMVRRCRVPFHDALSKLYTSFRPKQIILGFSHQHILWCSVDKPCWVRHGFAFVFEVFINRLPCRLPNWFWMCYQHSNDFLLPRISVPEQKRKHKYTHT